MQTWFLIKKFIFEKIVFIKTSSLIEIIMSLFSIISQMLVLLLTGYLIILKQVSIGSISSVGQISGNIFNSLTTFNQLQVSISSVNIIFEKFGAFEKSSHYRYIDKDIEEIKLTNVGYSFKDKEIFKNINCSFEKGKNYVPFLIAHGNADPLVPFSQSEQMVKRLEECGADVSFICVDHAEHEGSFWSLPLLDLFIEFFNRQSKLHLIE